MLVLWFVLSLGAVAQTMDADLHHVRNGMSREWAEFPEEPEAPEYQLEFDAVACTQPLSLQLTQHNVKQSWVVELNSKKLGTLHTDENPMVAFFEVPGGSFITGTNMLRITTTSNTPDDIRVGEVMIHDHPVMEHLNQGALRVSVLENNRPIPGRVTILQNHNNSERLMTTGSRSSHDMAVRPGVIYCRGTADIGLPAGVYTVIASRGPEYSIAETVVTLKEGESQSITMDIKREVPTQGFVSCDTHVHTLTHSRHGDASIEERMLTLAGEAIELPIATDHNLHIDYVPIAAQMELDQFFTPVIGNEVTTRIGHFNAFPVDSDKVPVPDYKASTWDDIFHNIRNTPGVQAIILNHARDIHSNYRPFDPRNHLAAIGHNMAGWKLQANAIEIINSGAQQTDMMRLVEDWMGMLNAGHQMTPVGCSDSHDVARFLVGQARTYIAADDSDVSRIDTTKAIQNFVDGRVTVSCGLFCNLKINDGFAPGDTAANADDYTAHVEVLGPAWVFAEEVEIYMNGNSVFRQEIPAESRSRAGLKHIIDVPLPWTFRNDAFVVAVARGAGVRRLHWPIARPYQPTLSEWAPQSMAITGAVWLDVDANGQRDAASDYADRLSFRQKSLKETVDDLAPFDSTVAMHAFARMFDYEEPNITSDLLSTAPPHIRSAYTRYSMEWRNSQLATEK